MTLRNIKASEPFSFHTAHELREFLNRFKATDLHAVYFTGTPLDHLTLHWETEVLSDDSEVNNLRVDLLPETARGWLRESELNPRYKQREENS